MILYYVDQLVASDTPVKVVKSVLYLSQHYKLITTLQTNYNTTNLFHLLRTLQKELTKCSPSSPNSTHVLRWSFSCLTRKLQGKVWARY